MIFGQRLSGSRGQHAIKRGRVSLDCVDQLRQPGGVLRQGMRFEVAKRGRDMIKGRFRVR